MLRALCTSWFYADGEHRGHDHLMAQGLLSGSDHALLPSRSCRPPQSRTRGTRGYTSYPPFFLRSGCPLQLTVRLGLWAGSRLENRDSSRSGIAHCARWVARLSQKTLSCHRWVMTSEYDWGSKKREDITVLPFSAGEYDWLLRREGNVPGKTMD